MNYFKPKEIVPIDRGMVERMNPYYLIREIAGYCYMGVRSSWDGSLLSSEG
jgi:hypothetical protein